MPRYVTPDVVEQARKVDLLSYLQATAPNELVRCGAEEYCTREHDSLKISHGKWYWWSRGIGGASALDYLVKGLGMDFVSAVQAVMNQAPAVRITPQPKHEKPTQPVLPQYTFDCTLHIYIAVTDEIEFNCICCVFIDQGRDIVDFHILAVEILACCGSRSVIKNRLNV